MLPTVNIENQNVEIVTETSLTYKLNLETETVGKKINDIEAIKQTINKILMTERYTYLAYDWQYGIQSNDLIGLPDYLIQPLLTERIKDALSIDDRIKDVNNFVFEKINKTELSVTFTVELVDNQLIESEWRWNNGNNV